MHANFALSLIPLLLLTAPVAAEPMDGSTTITCGQTTMLFRGAKAPNGFMVSSPGAIIVNDHGPATSAPKQAGFSVASNNTFITPDRYEPMGPVTVACAGGTGTLYVAARAW